MSYPLSTLAALISADLVARLVVLGQTALSGGQVLEGPEFLAQSDSFPRVVMIPIGGPIVGNTKDVSQPTPTATPNTRTQAMIQRSVGTLVDAWEVHVWGSNYDAAKTLIKNFIMSTHMLVSGQYKVTAYKWNDKTAIAHAGREAIFAIAIDTPIVDIPVVRAPTDTTEALISQITFPDGVTVPNP